MTLTISDLRRSGVLTRAGWSKRTYDFEDYWREARKLGVLATSAEPSCAIEDRLPLAGDTEFDLATRHALSCPRFGHWLSTPRNARRFETLVDAIEQEIDPIGATIATAESFARIETNHFDECGDSKVFREQARAAGLKRADLNILDDDVDYRTHEAWFLGERGVSLDLYVKELKEASAEWMRLELRRFGIDIRRGAFPDHRCRTVAPEPILPWPASSGVYFVAANDRVKIGKADHVAKRLSSLQTSSPYPLQLLAVAPGGLAEEHIFHARFKAYRRKGEWFDLAQPILELVVELRKAAS